MRDTGESDHRVADVIGIVERHPVGRLAIAPDGLLEIGALVTHAGRVYMIPRIGVSDAHLSMLRGEAEEAAMHGPDARWSYRGDRRVIGVRDQSMSSRESITACSSAALSGASFARRFQARS